MVALCRRFIKNKIIVLLLTNSQLLPHDAVQNAVLPGQSSVSLFDGLSIRTTLSYRDHTGWNISKII